MARSLLHNGHVWRHRTLARAGGSRQQGHMSALPWAAGDQSRGSAYHRLRGGLLPFCRLVCMDMISEVFLASRG